jgi:organic hydroperoxide reductase OsmC/OhrA
MDDKHLYEVNLEWKNARIGDLSSPVLNDKIEVATPPEFPKGIEGVWSPEHLFVSAVSSCLMTTFLAIAEY